MADTTVYVPDIPVDTAPDKLEEQIETRLKTGHRLTVHSVKCYTKLGVAVVKTMNDDDKDHLVQEVGTTVLDKTLGTTITFVDTLELESYIVIDQKLKKIPSADEVAQRYGQAYKTKRLNPCELVSTQFPNVFRILCRTLDELTQVADAPDFAIQSVFATVYPRAECHFLEDLPSPTDEKKISSAIATSIDEAHLPASSFYIQHNKHTGNALILASRTIRKWAKQGFVTIDGRNISKKPKLSYRVVVSPVPRGFDVDKILRHKLFAHRVVSHKLIDDKLIVELSELSHYQECLDLGGFGIDGKPLGIASYTASSNPESCELDAFNWYETDMLDMKPDITTVINDQQHPIFRYKWSADSFVQQMKKAGTSAVFVKGYDLTRHLLRVTVMLNTIGTLRKKKYVVDGEEIKLKLPAMRTIGYNHQSKLFSGRKVAEADWKTPYSSTSVKVINQDCLVLYEQLAAKGCRPLLLNMANATSPGGGYRKGDGAQEENVFRRSDYYHSLDGDLADKDRSERFFYTPKGEQKPLRGFSDYYPMEEFGAVYTSGITVFRGTEEAGYPYKKEPLCDVSAIAMAAYRNPPLTPKNTLQNRSAMDTYRKIENIFAIGHHQKHDCLVLSALGCGAFRNPPEHVALLFKAAIDQYAGYFESIYFAIIDDHNTGGAVNPHGNFRPFQDILHDLVVQAPKTLRVDGVSGPYRIVDKTSDGQLTLGDAHISQLPPCQHGNNCRDARNAGHKEQFSHPPRCSFQSATSECNQLDNDVHMFIFKHTEKCSKGGTCSSKDAVHLSDCDHPDFCKNEWRCSNTTSEHLSAWRHLPACRDGVSCPLLLNHEDDHIHSYRHIKSICPDDNCCSRFHDKLHTEHTTHSFREPCPFTPYTCAMFVDFFQAKDLKAVASETVNHCLRYSHVCPYGRLCKTTEDKHYETTIHIARELCPDGDKCAKVTKEDHLESYTHPSIRDIRLFCKHPGFACKQRFDDKHLKTYRHGQNFDHLTVAPSGNFNANVNFVRNQRHMIRNVDTFITGAKWPNTNVSSELRDWIRALQPSHRCRKEIFESILVHGHVMSRKYMKKLERPTSVAKAVLQHPRVRAVILKHNTRTMKDNAFKLIRALVFAEFAKTGADAVVADPDQEEEINLARKRLTHSLSPAELKTIDECTVQIAKASIALHGAPMGIGFDVDEKMGTDKHVFSILGPHGGFYYGDIVITFKQEIMFHPDSNFSVQAATSFNTGKTYARRPWVTNPGTDDKRVEDFHHSKLHCSVPRYEHAAAMELAAITGKSVTSMNVGLNDVLRRWLAVDSHETFEGHLPQLIPLDYVDCIYMPKNVFDSLTPEAQQSTKELFKKSLVFYDQPVDLTLLTAGIVPLDPTRKPYRQFIFDRMKEQIENRMQKPNIPRGIIITVPGSNLDEHIVIPLAISQSYDLYRLDNSKAPDKPEHTYIYWQAMNGDMMLTIANEKIEPSKDQANLRCLVCYVAANPSTTTGDYHENYSYLNDGHPLKHSAIVDTGKFRAKSNVFYRGCNTDDFFTFCLKLSYKTNEATLTHAGPNGIYNHQRIHCRFPASELDLSRIDYVHISGGNQDVPIRNLTINHEPVQELHPTFDKDFKKDTSHLVRKYQPSTDPSPEESVKPKVAKVSHSAVPKLRKPRVESAPSQLPEIAPPLPLTRPPKRGFWKRIKSFFFGTKIQENPPPLTASSVYEDLPNPLESSPSIYDSPIDEPPKPEPARARATSVSSQISTARTPPLITSKLPPCADSIYCLNQNVKEHTDKYSHPCRFNELCRQQAAEPHLIHQHHKVPKCTKDKDCTEKTDPVHRAEYRHTGLSDFLLPCRHQDTCYNTLDDHRLRYFHGEAIPSIKKRKSSAAPPVRAASKARIVCKFGDDCRDKNDPQHTAKFSHPT